MSWINAHVHLVGTLEGCLESTDLLYWWRQLESWLWRYHTMIMAILLSLLLAEPKRPFGAGYNYGTIHNWVRQFFGFKEFDFSYPSSCLQFWRIRCSSAYSDNKSLQKCDFWQTNQLSWIYCLISQLDSWKIVTLFWRCFSLPVFSFTEYSQRHLWMVPA
jgi:hypothetical protein